MAAIVVLRLRLDRLALDAAEFDEQLVALTGRDDQSVDLVGSGKRPPSQPITRSRVPRQPDVEVGPVGGVQQAPALAPARSRFEAREPLAVDEEHVALPADH